MWFVILCRSAGLPEVMRTAPDHAGGEQAYREIASHGLPRHCTLVLAEGRTECGAADQYGFQPARNPWWTPREVADALGCSLSYVYELIQAGELKGFSIGRRKMVYRDSVDQYRERHPLPTTSDKPPPARRPGRRRAAAPPAETPTPFRHLG